VPAEGVEEVLMPGEPEARREAERLRTGIPISSEVLASLEVEAKEMGVILPALSPFPLTEPA
jgi:LDH2 family malate/lactate/ureidoglycolate dehydrogenase